MNIMHSSALFAQLSLALVLSRSGVCSLASRPPLKRCQCKCNSVLQAPVRTASFCRTSRSNGTCTLLSRCSRYYPTGTMERVEVEGQVATAHTMAMLFSAVPPSRSGPVDIFIVDIHALQERFYFDQRSSVVNPISAIDLFIKRLLAKFPIGGSSIPMKFAFPDEGAFKRFGKLLEAKCPLLYHGGNVVICGKVRCLSHTPAPSPPPPHARAADARGRRPSHLDHRRQS